MISSLKMLITHIAHTQCSLLKSQPEQSGNHLCVRETRQSDNFTRSVYCSYKTTERREKVKWNHKIRFSFAQRHHLRRSRFNSFISSFSAIFYHFNLNDIVLLRSSYFSPRRCVVICFCAALQWFSCVSMCWIWCGFVFFQLLLWRKKNDRKWLQMCNALVMYCKLFVVCSVSPELLLVRWYAVGIFSLSFHILLCFTICFVRSKSHAA